MALLEEKTVAAIAATSAVLSPRVRRMARKGAVYGVAGIIQAGDVVVAAARGISRASTSPEPAEATRSRGNTAARTSAPARTRSARAAKNAGRAGSASASTRGSKNRSRVPRQGGTS
jgi:hypothetical protein